MGTSFATIAEKDRSTIILNELCAVEYSVATRLLLDEGLIFSGDVSCGAAHLGTHVALVKYGP